MSLVTDLKRDIYELRYNVRFEVLKNSRRRRFLTVMGLSSVLALLFYLVPLLSGSDFPDVA